MRKRSPFFWLLAALGFAAAAQSAWAQRAVSSETAAALSAGYTYQPPPPAKSADAEEADLRETDRPRNGIVRLPKYVVETERPPVFSERDLYTKENLQKLAMARYLSPFDRNVLNRWTLPLPGGFFSNEARAMEEYHAQERLRGISTMTEQANLYRVGDDPARAEATQEQSRSTYLRTNLGPSAPRASGAQADGRW